jgi:dTDP-4-amino-4,6-dideoxy-D-galactose acyltransferase
LSELVRFLEWDSAFFARRIARVLPEHLTSEQLKQIEAWCQHEAIDCLYLLAASNDGMTTALAEDKGFHLVDLRLTFERKISSDFTTLPPASGFMIRPHQPSDLDVLVAISRKSFTDARFYYDSCFSVEKADQFYEIWIRNSTNGSGFADEVLIADANGLTLGYISCKRRGTLGEIGLVGVEGAARGAGVGAALVNASLEWFAKHGCERVQVITQGRNLVAQRLYQRAGFLTSDLKLWYHKWYQNCR